MSGPRKGSPLIPSSLAACGMQGRRLTAEVHRLVNLACGSVSLRPAAGVTLPDPAAVTAGGAFDLDDEGNRGRDVARRASRYERATHPLPNRS